VTVYKTVQELRSAKYDRLFFPLISKNINYAKMRISLDIFEELGLVELSASRQSVTVLKATKKVDLDNSYILQALKNS
ncbi:hypothetical protein, partial [Klebsiella pneumoniae]|uniref:hypothetical protein n=1 Tax=Klebsiella pneumoniae TaxID=573 RepID=UPI003AF961D0